MEYRKHEVISGLFIALAAFVFGLFAFKVGDVNFFGFLQGETLACVVYYDDVKSLASGAPVKVGGQVVGEVKNVFMDEGEHRLEQSDIDTKNQERGVTSEESDLKTTMVHQLIRVEFEIFDPRLRISKDRARVKLWQDSPLAPHFLDLDPGEWNEGEQLLSVTSPLEASHEVKRGKATDFNDLVVTVAPVVDRINELVSRLSRVFNRIDTKLLNDTNYEHIGKILSNLDGFSGEARETLARFDSILEGRGELGAKLGRVLASVDKLTTELDGDVEDLRKRIETVLDQVSPVLTEALALLGENRDDLREVTRRMRRTLWYTEVLTRKLAADPSLVIWGEDGEGLFEPAERDDTWLRSSARVGPYGQRDETND